MYPATSPAALQGRCTATSHNPLQEDLEATIAPSVESLLTALEAYRAAGGEGLIFVNDDGLQLIDKFERRALLQPAPAYVPGN